MQFADAVPRFFVSYASYVELVNLEVGCLCKVWDVKVFVATVQLKHMSHAVRSNALGQLKATASPRLFHHRKVTA